MADEAEENVPSPAEITGQALCQLAECIEVAATENAFMDANAHNNALVAAMAMTGFVPNILASDYIEAQKCIGEMMSALFSALGIPRAQHGAFAAGMLDGITAAKNGQIVRPTGVEVSTYGAQLRRRRKR